MDNPIYISPKKYFRKAAVDIVRQLVSNGYEAYIVGGAVRDLLLGDCPKDFDIATSATPEQVRKVFSRHRCRIIGRRFRLAHVFCNGEIYEVSTFRREPTLEERHGLKPSDGIMIWNDNQYGTLQDDAKRRDFTVNALYCDVAKQGEIIDMTGGLADLHNRLVRCVGNPKRRFEEDPVRMLRALKLCGLHHLRLEEQTQQALRQTLPTIVKASKARLFDELMKVLFTINSEGIFAAFHDGGLLQYLLPGMEAIWDTPNDNLMRQMLKMRDRCLAEDPEYFSSKSLALTVPVFPLIYSILVKDDVAPKAITRQMIDECDKAIHDFYQGHDIPHAFSTKILSTCITLQSLLPPHRLNNHVINREYYANAFELLRLFSMVSGKYAELLCKLPLPSEPPPEKEVAFISAQHEQPEGHGPNNVILPFDRVAEDLESPTSSRGELRRRSNRSKRHKRSPQTP